MRRFIGVAAVAGIIIVVTVSALYLPSILFPHKISTVHVVLTAAGYFSPRNILVIIGTNNTVQWTIDDPAGGHTVTEGNQKSPTPTPLFDSGAMTQGGSYTYTFMIPGTFHYYDGAHIDVTGTVTVES